MNGGGGYTKRASGEVVCNRCTYNGCTVFKSVGTYAAGGGTELHEDGPCFTTTRGFRNRFTRRHMALPHCFLRLAAPSAPHTR